MLQEDECNTRGLNKRIFHYSEVKPSALCEILDNGSRNELASGSVFDLINKLAAFYNGC